MSKTEYTIDDVKREAGQEEKEKKHVQRLQLIVFKLGTEEYAMPIEQIKEVVLTPQIAKMPQTPPYIKGVANIRGNIIAIMDLGQKFNLQEAIIDVDSAKYTLVVESEKFKIGLLVKDVPNTLTVTVDDIDSAADFVQYTSLNADSLVGVVKAKDRMIILVDMIKLVEAEDMNLNI